MSTRDLADEFSDPVFTRTRRAWWADLDVPGVNVCTDERLTVSEAFERHLPWTVRKVNLYDPETFNPVDAFVHKRSDRPPTAPPIGRSAGRFSVVQNSDVDAMLTEALDGIDYAVASIGALTHGAITFVSVDFPDQPDVNAAGQTIAPFLSIVNQHDGRGSLRAYATGIRPECLNTIDLGWMSGVQLGRLAHTTNIAKRIPQMRDEIRRYLDLVPVAEKAVGRLIDATIDPDTARLIVEALIPIPDGHKVGDRVKNKGTITRQTRKREQIVAMIDPDAGDPRVGHPGTVWGLWQAFTTWEQHDRRFRRSRGVDTLAQSSLVRHMTGVQSRFDGAALSGILDLVPNPPARVQRARGLVLT